MQNNEYIRNQVIQALKTVFDPEIPINIYDLGLIYDIEIENNKVHINMTLTSPNCPIASAIPEWVINSIKQYITELDEINVNLVWDPPWTTDLIAEYAKVELGII